MKSVFDIHPFVQCDDEGLYTLYVRVTDALGQSAEGHIVIHLRCHTCPMPPMGAVVVPNANPPESDQYFRDHEPYMHIPPPPPPDIEPRPNMYFTVINLSDYADTTFVYQLSQSQNWPVAQLLPSQLNLAEGASRVVPFYVQFPSDADTTNNEFTLRVTSVLDPSRTQTGKLIAVAPSTTAVPETASAGMPLRFGLQHVFPDPFEGSTTIQYHIADPGRAVLRVYDLGGRMVREIFDREEPTGPRVAGWDGRNERGQKVSSGIYFLRLASHGQLRARRVVVMR